MNEKTIRTFESEEDVMGIVQKWVEENGYGKVPNTGEGTLFQKGMGFWVAPMMIRVIHNGDQVTVEASIEAKMLARIMALFMLPASMGIESGGFKGVLPRKMMRTAVNKLLGEFGQEPIS